MFQLEKFRNFKRNFQNSITTLTSQLNKIYGCRVFVEPLEMTVESMTHPIKEEKVEIAMFDEPLQDNDDHDYEMEDDESESQSMEDLTDSDSSFDVPKRNTTRKSQKNNKRLEAIKGKYKVIKPILRKPKTSNELYCSICKITVETPPFMTHCKEVHLTELGNDKYQCKICNKELKFESTAGIYNHFDLHREYSEPKACDHCDETFIVISEWRKHYKTHRRPTYQCLECSAKFSRLVQNLYPHIMEEHTDANFCRFCSETFKTKTELDKHLIEERRNYNALQRKKYKDNRGGSNKKKLGRKKKYQGSDREESESEHNFDDSQTVVDKRELETIPDTSIKTEAVLEITADYDYSLDQWDANYIGTEEFIDESDSEIQQENGSTIEYRVEQVGGRTRVYTESKGKVTKWRDYIKKYKHKLPARQLVSFHLNIFF